MLKQLKQVQRYRARYLMRDGTSVVAERATLDGIYSRIAWWLITDKHGYGFPEIHGMVCLCDDHHSWVPDDCELHHRINGYYYRLHRRIVRWLKAGYIQPALDAPPAAE